MLRSKNFLYGRTKKFGIRTMAVALATAGVYHYDIAMSVPVTNFIGAFSITDLTSGLSGGSVTELIFSGDVPTSRLRNHTYSGTIAGEAFFAGVSVAHTAPNNPLYTYNDF